MINLYHSYKPLGKVVYCINGERFYNTSSQLHDGKQKALEYAYKHDLNEDCIIKFDSDLECNRYEYLSLCEEEGKISNLEHHKVIQLLPEFVNANGDIIRPTTYNVDFIYNEGDKTIYEDVKGASLLMDTRFEVLKSLFDYEHRNKNEYIKIVIYRDKERVEWKLGDKKKPLTAKQKRIAKQKALAKQLADKEKKEREIARVSALYQKYISLPKLTKVQRERLEKYKEFLTDNGILL